MLRTFLASSLALLVTSQTVRADGSLETQLVASPAPSGYGTAVAIDGDVAAVTALSGQTVSVFRFVGGSWVFEQSLSDSNRSCDVYLYGFCCPQGDGFI